jgi:hypothetical protein
MRTGIVTALSAVVIMTLGLLGCGGSDGDDGPGSVQSAEPTLPEVTSEEAEQAMSDAMLISALSLFLAFSAEEGDSMVSNEEGSLSLAWDDSADFTTGIGLYTITMTNYAIPEDDPFGAEYNGYVLDGTVVMGSTDGISTTMKMDLSTSHENAESYPVQSIDLNLEGIQESADPMPTGHIKINGHPMSFEDLARALELGG